MTNKKALVPRPDNRIVAAQNDLAVLKLLRDFGHLRRSEIARGVWPNSSTTVATKMANRTVRRLREKGYVREKPNSLGGRSLVLTARGATWLQLHGVEAHDGYELSSVAGPHFYHRTLGTRYLLERAAGGHKVFGEYALQKGFGPIGRGELAERFQKLPDGIVLAPGHERGYDRNVIAADWVEVESSYKPEQELSKIFAIAWSVGSWLDAAETIMLDRVLFIYNSRQRHENTILRALQRYLGKHPATNTDLLLSIVLVRCQVGLPLVWQGFSEFDSAHLLKAKGLTISGTDE